MLEEGWLATRKIQGGGGGLKLCLLKYGVREV